MDNKQATWGTSVYDTLKTEAAQGSNSSEYLPAEDGVMRIGATRVGNAYIFERKDSNPSSDWDLIFQYDLAGNQILREVKEAD